MAAARRDAARLWRSARLVVGAAILAVLVLRGSAPARSSPASPGRPRRRSSAALAITAADDGRLGLAVARWSPAGSACASRCARRSRRTTARSSSTARCPAGSSVTSTAACGTARRPVTSAAACAASPGTAPPARSCRSRSRRSTLLVLRVAGAVRHGGRSRSRCSSAVLLARGVPRRVRRARPGRLGSRAPCGADLRAAVLTGAAGPAIVLASVVVVAGHVGGLPRRGPRRRLAGLDRPAAAAGAARAAGDGRAD